MKKYFKINLMLILVFSLSGCELFESYNDKLKMVFNSSVEVESFGQPEAWRNYAEGDYKAEWVDNEYSSPNHSLKLSTSVLNSEKYCYWFQSSYTVVHNKEMKLKVKVKVDDVVGEGVYFTVSGMNARNYRMAWINTKYEFTITGTHDWQEYIFDIYPLPESTVKVSINLVLGKNTTGTVYFDDISLEY